MSLAEITKKEELYHTMKYFPTHTKYLNKASPFSNVNKIPKKTF